MLSDNIVITGGRALARSYAKINLTLDVLNRRDNGYHDVEMVMQTVSLFDLIIIDKAEGGIHISTNLPYLPSNEKNIAYKAAQAFFTYTGINGSARILMHKNIPVAAGLAGGSGNAAAVLCALDKLYGTQLSCDELCNIAAQLGADVPYCIIGGTALAQGIGEILTPLKNAPKMTVLMVKPPVNISTALIYESIDNEPIEHRPDTGAMLRAIENQDIYGICNNLSNVMQDVTSKICPVVGGIQKKMLMNGAIGAVMSGSGPTVFGIFDDWGKAKKSHDSFACQYRDVFLVNTL